MLEYINLLGSCGPNIIILGVLQDTHQLASDQFWGQFRSFSTMGYVTPNSWESRPNTIVYGFLHLLFQQFLGGTLETSLGFRSICVHHKVSSHDGHA